MWRIVCACANLRALALDKENTRSGTMYMRLNVQFFKQPCMEQLGAFLVHMQLVYVADVCVCVSVCDAFSRTLPTIADVTQD